MILYYENDWYRICDRMKSAGLDSLPVGVTIDSYLDSDRFLWFKIEVPSPEDEVWFRLKWE